MSLIITRDVAAAKQRVLSIVARLGLSRHFLECDPKTMSLSRLLAQLPLCGKSELAAHGRDAIEEQLEKALLFSETSGTTSAPLNTPRGTVDLKWNTLNQVFAYKRHLQPGVDHVAILHPGVLSPFVEASARALQELGVGYARVYPIPHVCEYERIYGVLDRYRITTIMSTPTLVYKLLYELKAVGNGVLPRSLKKLLLTGEHFSQVSAFNLGRMLGPEGRAVPFVYGSSEAATLMVGMEDGTYRAIPEDFIFEIVPTDAVPTDTQPDRLSGRLVVTWLREGLLPILRYDTNDLFTVEKDVATGDYVFHFEGRTTPYVLDARQKDAIERTVYGFAFPVFHYECLAQQNRREIMVTIVTSPSDAPASLGDAAEHLARQLGDNWSVTFAVNPPDSRFYEFSPTPKTNRYRTN
ncbi:coenzyme F390 synthetase-like protein [Burkholderia glumae]|uniref:coenzyme F390 synthetase-like protein n=1 Tax=Burkholderia glumae TaxID=337 RepID=UPI0001A4A522|nr:coenzyme F390 synthetase-like protein [Burkholderia glumae]ACR32866.1 Coenzyme F390 synthetase-like protein [Burkholderia glumae BGR1]MCM2543922.1 CoF synthetase [Burkholderia glumae]